MINHFLLPLINTQIQEEDRSLPIPLPLVDQQFLPANRLQHGLETLRQICLGYPKDRVRLFLQSQFLLKIIHAIPEADEYIKSVDSRITYLENLTQPLAFGIHFSSSLSGKCILQSYDFYSEKYLSYGSFTLQRQDNTLTINNQTPIPLTWKTEWSQWIPIFPEINFNIALHYTFSGAGTIKALFRPKINPGNIIKEIQQNVPFHIYEEIKTILPTPFKSWLNTPCDDLRQLAAYVIGYDLLFFAQHAA